MATIETKNLLIERNENTKQWECFRKIGVKRCFIARSEYQTALVASMRMSMNRKYEVEINEAIGQA